MPIPEEDPMTKPRDTSLASEGLPPRGERPRVDAATDEEVRRQGPKRTMAVRQEGSVGDVSGRDETTR